MSITSLWSVLSPHSQPLASTYLFPVSVVLSTVFEKPSKKDVIYLLDSISGATSHNLQTLKIAKMVLRKFYDIIQNSGYQDKQLRHSGVLFVLCLTSWRITAKSLHVVGMNSHVHIPLSFSWTISSCKQCQELTQFSFLTRWIALPYLCHYSHCVPAVSSCLLLQIALCEQLVPPALFSSFGDFGEGAPQSSAPGSESVDRLQLVLLTAQGSSEGWDWIPGPPAMCPLSQLWGLTLAWLVWWRGWEVEDRGLYKWPWDSEKLKIFAPGGN